MPVLITQPEYTDDSPLQRYGLLSNFLSTRPIGPQAWNDGVLVENVASCGQTATDYPQSICNDPNPTKPAAADVLVESELFVPHWSLTRGHCSMFPMGLELAPYAKRWLDFQMELTIENDLGVTLSAAPLNGTFDTVECALAAAEASVASTVGPPRTSIYVGVHAASLLFNNHVLVEGSDGLLYTRLGNRVVVLRSTPNPKRIYIAGQDRTEIWLSEPRVLSEESFRDGITLGTNDRFVTYEQAHILVHLACYHSGYDYTECIPV